MSSDRIHYAEGTVIEPLAVFPLPQVVLFPGMLLPLHIFEPRYRAMTEDVLEGSRQMSVALITGGKPVEGRPTIARVAGLGEVVQHERLSDGRFNIVLLGRARVELDELPFVGPYRRARARVRAPVEAKVNQADVNALMFSVARFATEVRRRAPEFRLELPSHDDPGALSDACAHHLLIEGEDRQRVLETLDVAERVRCCTEVLAVQVAALGEPRTLQ